jgi:hypothetical protein
MLPNYALNFFNRYSMQNDEFLKLVKSHADKTNAEVKQVDWGERLTWWLGKLDKLIVNIDQWLSPLNDQTDIAFVKKKYQIHEEKLGSYEANGLVVNFINASLEFKPVGSVIIGGYGRVDVIGPEGKALLILTYKDETIAPENRRELSEWFISHPNRRASLNPLTQETFQQLFTDLFGLKS